MALTASPSHLQNGAEGQKALGRAFPFDADDFRQPIVGLLGLVDFQVQHTDFNQHLRVLRCQAGGEMAKS